MSKKIVSRVESFLKTKVDPYKNREEFDSAHSKAVAELNKIVYDMIQTKFKPDCDNWRGVESLVWSKKEVDAFWFTPVRTSSSIGQRLKSHANNLAIAQSAIERLANEAYDGERQAEAEKANQTVLHSKSKGTASKKKK